MRATFASEVEAAGLSRGPATVAAVSEDELGSLPPPVQRYMRRMGVLDHPRDWSFRLHCHGRFKPAIDAAWKPAESWQYNSAGDVARIFHMRLQFYGIPVIGRDVYLRGTGYLAIRPLDLVTATFDAGPAFDSSELATWLDEALLFAPSMLLGARTTWHAIDDDAFDVTLSDAGHSVSARVCLDARATPLEVTTDSRSFRDPARKRLRRARWSTPIQGWQVTEGHRIPTRARAIWHLPAGDFAYAELDIAPSDVAFNVAPGCLS